ncbi:MAG: large conductance mechanosensitive channel protein MscL [Acutalibacteraceae bacterium]
MKKFFGEFKTFIMRGNVLDLAVAVIIGAAFQSIITSLCDDLISPLLGMFGGLDFSKYVFTINGVDFKYGSFITAVINFIIMAFIIFLLVKLVNKVMSIGKKEEAIEEAKTKTCPFCKSEIDKEATKCPHCTSDL